MMMTQQIGLHYAFFTHSLKTQENFEYGKRENIHIADIIRGIADERIGWGGGINLPY